MCQIGLARLISITNYITMIFIYCNECKCQILLLIPAVGSTLILTWVTYVSCPDLSICENLQFRISFMTFCYVTLPIYIHTPEGYSFSRKLYGINVRNLSTPPGTWYFLNSQRHDRWVSCANSERSNDLLFCLWCCRELISVRRYSVVKVRRLR